MRVLIQKNKKKKKRTPPTPNLDCNVKPGTVFVKTRDIHTPFLATSNGELDEGEDEHD